MDPKCQTTPPQEFTSSGDAAVCGIHYTNCDDDSSTTMYRLQSYPNKKEATKHGAEITHVGGKFFSAVFLGHFCLHDIPKRIAYYHVCVIACGVCSSTYDLAGLIKNSNKMENILIGCIKPNFPPLVPQPNVPAIISCVVANAELNPSCARLWVSNGLKLPITCPQCFEMFSSPVPPNLDNCELNECLKCEEQNTLPTFAKFAGRRRGGAGLLTLTVRSCDETSVIEHSECSTDAQLE